MNLDLIGRMISDIIDASLPWIKEIDGSYQFIDPLDGIEISAHYGATHMAAALIIEGCEESECELLDGGLSLLRSIMSRWDNSKQLPGFHNDFNNFALCVVWNYLNDAGLESALCNEIKEIVNRTPDSNNPTVNWLPMRWYVNKLRYQWTLDDKYARVCEGCRRTIREATYNDGFIEDRLPKGISFNLQYDVATVAAVQFLNTVGEKIDVSKELGALISAVAPDGDINYFGRGTNQIFAWGPWIFLLASSGLADELKRAALYLLERLPMILSNHGMMLNDFPGEEKCLWWDYHYCSVYTAHLLLWLVLAKKHSNHFLVEATFSDENDSGFVVVKNDNFFAAIFNGRNEYLAEKGPIIAALWTNLNGMITKGAYGPWQGPFGNFYSNELLVLLNGTGLHRVSQNYDFQKNRIIHKLLPDIQSRESMRIEPIFAPVSVNLCGGYAEILWTNINHRNCCLLIPCMVDLPNAELFVDGEKVLLSNDIMFKNQYGWARLYQSKVLNGKEWKLSLRL